MKKLVIAIALLVSVVTIGSECFAHGGGLDRMGGHYVRTAGPGRIVGTYHFHR